jgi:DNA-binding NtrC family response regulator
LADVVTTQALLSSSSLIGRSKAILNIRGIIEKVSATEVPICVYGDPGTGKSLVSRAIHDGSQRRDGPFLTVECTATPSDLVECRLFGHVGTGESPVEGGYGLLMQAHSGSLILNELTALGARAQAQLLSVLRTRTWRVTGSSDSIRCDVRLITTMTREPKRAVEEGLLSEDLYYRVAVVLIRLPPLRERREDIPLLIDHFLRQLSRAHGRRFTGVAPAVLGQMIQRPWPGNIRELEVLLAAACDRAQGEVLTDQDFSPTYHRATRNA